MNNPYDMQNDAMFSKFFGKLLTKGEIMNNDIPCDNEHLEKLENACREYQGDIEIVLEAIQQNFTEYDMKLLFVSPLAFGERIQDSVLDYIQSKVEEEYGE